MSGVTGSAPGLAGVWCYRFSAWLGVNMLCWQVFGVTGSVLGLVSICCAGRCLVLHVQCLDWCQCTMAGVLCNFHVKVATRKIVHMLCILVDRYLTKGHETSLAFEKHV